MVDTQGMRCITYNLVKVFSLASMKARLSPMFQLKFIPSKLHPLISSGLMCGIGKFHRGDKIRNVGLGFAEANLFPEVEFPNLI